ncbi:Polyketide synthase [Halomicronema hongdechloris C2206]|uniref:Polyketide synthase n=1 Tax=Halomicronema hongdechloris C2206 TaxID=1641165 RepID=A0A1Z3HHA8_9CYAN|nr:sulfotransferase [Halomicronema hongdechloris]ASC69665.1 Polyketide synthase [Halomicronema hongdechloris C2206]
MADNPRKVVFILGIGRSGSTMLDLMLGTHSQGFSLGEISKIPQIFQRQQTVAAFCPSSSFWPDHFSEADARRLAIGLSGHRLHRHVPLKLERWLREWLGQDAILHPYTLLLDRIGQPLLIDSSKYPDWVSRQLQGREFRQGHIQAYLLHVVRDGRAVLNSYLRAYPDWTVEKISRRWLDNLTHSQQVYERFPAARKMRVRYERLATQPEATMQAVCQLLEIPYEPAMLAYWSGNHHYVAGSRSARALIARYRQHPIAANVQNVHGSYYQDMEMTIKLDQRWRQELSTDKIDRFYRIVGDRNRPYEWDDLPAAH